MGVYLQPEISYLEERNTASVALVVSEDHDEAVWGTVDLAEPFEVELLPGHYYFYVLVLDPRASDLMSAYTFAIGLPVTVNMDDFDDFTVVDGLDALLEMTTDEAQYVPPGGPYRLDLILLPLDEFAPVSDDRRLSAVLGMSGGVANYDQ